MFLWLDSLSASQCTHAWAWNLASARRVCACIVCMPHSNMSIRLLHHHLLDWPQRPPSSTLSLVLRIKLQSGPPEQQPSIRTLNRVVRKGEVSHFFVLASPCSLFYFNVCSSDGLLMRIHVASPCYLLVQKLT